jgi:hypothetical protein
MPRWRRPTEAITDFVDSIKAIIRIVTPIPIDTPDRYNPSPALVRSLELGADRPVPLRGPGRISFQIRLRYQIIGGDDDGWGVQIVAYQYALLDRHEHEIVAYHWHPDGPSAVVTPHLHLGAGAAAGRVELMAAHLPTGPIPLAALICLAVEAFDIQPFRRQWDTVLRQAEAAFIES